MPVSFLQRSLAWAFRISKQNRRTKPLRSIETLEPRVVLVATTDAAATPDFRVTVTTFEYSSTDTDIKAVLENLSTDSSTIISVATSGLVEREPRVAMDSGGNWAVVWTEVATSGDLNVKAKLYDKNGAAKSGTINVATSTSVSDFEPVVAMGPNGFSSQNAGFVVAWTRQTSSSNKDVFWARYSNTGTVLNSATAVANDSTQDESAPTIARDSNARFIIAYQYEFSSSDDDIRARTYTTSSNVVTAGSVTTIIGTGAREQAPSIAIDLDGTAVFAWQQYNSTEARWDVASRVLRTSGTLWPVFAPGQTGSSDRINPTVGVFYSGVNDTALSTYILAYEQETGVNSTRGIVREVTPTSSGNSSSTSQYVEGNFGNPIFIATPQGFGGIIPPAKGYLYYVDRNKTWDPFGGTTLFSIESNGSIQSFNSAPVLTLSGSPTTFVENSSPLLIASTTTLSDADGFYSPGYLEVEISSGGDSSDELAIRNEGTASTQINISGSSVRYGSTTIGTFSQTSGSNAKLRINFTSTVVSATAVRALIRNITFSNTSDAPSTSTRSIRFELFDGDFGGGLQSSRSISVTAANDAPRSLSLSANTIPENSASGTAIGNFSSTDPDPSNTFTYSLVTGTGSTDNGSFSIVGSQLRSNAVFDFEAKSSYSIRVRTTDQSNLSFEQSFTVNVTNAQESPTLNNAGSPFVILGAGSRQSAEMRQGVLVSELLARGAGGNPISDPDAGALKGIALTAVDQSLGSFQYTLVTSNPQESDWVNVDAAGAISNTSALLLPTTARLRFNTGRIPHHASADFFLSVESKLDTGLTFRAWDQTSGAAGGRANTSTNGGATAFSTATETSKVYFEVRLFRSFNPNASLNVYTLEAEFNALTGGAFQDRSTSAYSGFTVLLSPVPELGTSALFRLYFGIQFNDNGTAVDMGYRYLTSSQGEAEFLESIGPAAKRPQREGAYFRELGVSNGTATIGYVFNTQQPGTSQLMQIYRTDVVNKPTRPPGTTEGGTPTSFTPQENGDHVYTTNTAYEMSQFGTWRAESARGFVRESTPSPMSGAATATAMAAATGEPTTEIAAVDFAAATETSTSFATASITRRSATAQSTLPALSTPSLGLPLVTNPGNGNLDRLIADLVRHHGSDSAEDLPGIASAAPEASARDTVLAAPARCRTVSTSVPLGFLDEAFLDQTFVDAVTVAI
jgi:hypothetical protein